MCLFLYGFLKWHQLLCLINLQISSTGINQLQRETTRKDTISITSRRIELPLMKLWETFVCIDKFLARNLCKMYVIIITILRHTIKT